MSSSTTRHSPHRASRQRTTGAYRLVRTPPGSVEPPLLDAAQRAVVDHTEGPLLVLAGPGTGKTTTLVESVAARVERGSDPARILVLTFSRKAAVELRDRMAARLGAARGPQATTFHSYCYALVRAHQDADLFADPLRLLSGPEQDVTVRELLAGQLDLEKEGLAHVRWPDELRACLTTRGFADEVRAVLARSRELGLGPDALAAFARRTGRPDWSAAAQFLAEYLDILDAQGGPGLRRAGAPGGAARGAPRGGGRPGRPLRRGVRRRVPGHRPGPGAPAARAGREPGGAHPARAPCTRGAEKPPRTGGVRGRAGVGGRWSRSATPTSRSTRSGAPT